MKSLRLTLLLLVLLASVGAWQYFVWIEWRHNEEVREEQTYSLIEEGFYVGPYVREPPPGTEVVLNLCEMRDPYEADVHLWEPISDGDEPPGIEWLWRMAEFIDAHRAAGKTVYVHCAAGVSRSGLVAAGYLMYEHGWTREQALEFLRTKRPQIRPHPAFMELLHEWEEFLHEVAPGGEQ